MRGRGRLPMEPRPTPHDWMRGVFALTTFSSLFAGSTPLIRPTQQKPRPPGALRDRSSPCMTPPPIHRRAHPLHVAFAALAMLAGLLAWSMPAQAQTKPGAAGVVAGGESRPRARSSPRERACTSTTHIRRRKTSTIMWGRGSASSIGFLSGRLIPRWTTRPEAEGRRDYRRSHHLCPPQGLLRRAGHA